MFDYWAIAIIAKNITRTFDTLGRISGSYGAYIAPKQSG
jgi:hypothetical protein